MDNKSPKKFSLLLRYFFFGALFTITAFFLVLSAGWLLYGSGGFLAKTLFGHTAINDDKILQQSDDNFASAQYYFNSGPQADGTYDLEKARHYYEQHLQYGTNVNNIAWYQLGRIDFLEGNFDDALYKFERQKELFGETVASVNYMLGLTYAYRARRNNSQEDWQKAETAFLRQLSLNPTTPWTCVDLAWVYFAQGKYAEMIPILERRLVDHPDNPWLLNMYGLALFNTNQTQDALTTFNKAERFATMLTPEMWGASYPGNDPEDWPRGLEEFRAAISKNRDLAVNAL